MKEKIRVFLEDYAEIFLSFKLLILSFYFEISYIDKRIKFSIDFLSYEVMAFLFQKESLENLYYFFIFGKKVIRRY